MGKILVSMNVSMYWGGLTLATILTCDLWPLTCRCPASRWQSSSSSLILTLTQHSPFHTLTLPPHTLTAPCTPTVPCPPGYMHRKMRPNSSACTLPAGVSSPPHFRMRTSEGSRGESPEEKPAVNGLRAWLHDINNGFILQLLLIRMRNKNDAERCLSFWSLKCCHLVE